MNQSQDVVPLRSGDAVRLHADWSADGLESLTIDLSARDSETHCLVSLPSLWERTGVPDPAGTR